MSWRYSALCAQVDVGDLFFPEKGGTTRPAKEVCAKCPVRVPCLEEALANPNLSGIWGGKSELERRAMRPHTLAYIECTVDGCDLPHMAKGYCSTHYNRLARGRMVTR